MQGLEEQVLGSALWGLPFQKPPWLPATRAKIWGRGMFHVDRRKPKHSLLPNLIDF